MQEEWKYHIEARRWSPSEVAWLMSLTQIPGVAGWFDAEGLKRPCPCGGTLFWAYKWGLRCVKCVPQNWRKPENLLGIVDIEHLERGLQKERIDV